ncbi:MAG: prepilin-type N-terminal cleavage/methylation domain-containing protein [Fusobacterium sp.]|nr:prepilin-type N-terminal cleavage/methylation domain-containing protein [Fusobacterium sp.]
MKKAFTMAEILLSLTIIGVVAAITLPSLTGNINERTWNTQRKALYARFSQALALMPALNGYGIVTQGDESSSSFDNAAETFVTDGLAKVLKINNICDSEHLTDCGLPEKITPQNNAEIIYLNNILTLSSFNDQFTSSFLPTDIKTAGFETANGESILVYYNPNCVSDENEAHYVQNKMCANFLFDLNGKKGPNTAGKDIGFITALYPSDSVVVAPDVLIRGNIGTGGHKEAGQRCREQNNESRLPNRDELAAMFYNKQIIGIIPNENAHHFYWSSTLYDANNAWGISFADGHRRPNGRNYTPGVWCIKR